MSAAGHRPTRITGFTGRMPLLDLARAINHALPDDPKAGDTGVIFYPPNQPYLRLSWRIVPKPADMFSRFDTIVEATSEKHGI